MLEAVLQSWRPDFWLTFFLLLAAWIYTRGWRHLHTRLPGRFDFTRLAFYYAGLGLLFIATASPLDAFSNLLLTAHMIQHLLLMMLIPPLILLGAPFLPLIRGLPSAIRKEALGPFLQWRALQKVGRLLTHPLLSLSLFLGIAILWHIPFFYELALHSKPWHDVEHFCFFITAILFWWPVIQPWPAVQQWPRWTMIPYLLIADLQNTALSAFLIFYERVIYPTYAAVPRLFGLSVLQDQAAAGSIMWVPGSLAYLVPVALITIQLLSPKHAAPTRKRTIVPKFRSARFPVVSLRFVEHRLFRRVLQIIMFGLAIAVILDGLFGPAMSPLNLAGVLPWIHWRGLIVISLLIAGNFFCMACPFMLTRDLGRRFLPARWRWPKRLRSKWLAVALLAIYLWAYEVFSLWNSPLWTAWIVIGYFVGAFFIDGFFQGASFCKYVCPIGQFNFVQSLVSPLEVKVRDIDVCKNCKTYDCIRGNSVTRGCELQLFQPKKAGNVDCTFCLDCIHACPHNNVGILAAVPGKQLLHDGNRSSLKRLSRRIDFTALVLLLVFGAFVNAAGMVSAVAIWEQAVKQKLGFSSVLPVTTVLMVFGLVILPASIAMICGFASRILSRNQIRTREVICSLTLSLIPIGFGMWSAHLLFHFFNGAGTAMPVIQRALSDLKMYFFHETGPTIAFASSSLSWITSLQFLLLDSGFLMTLYLAWRIAQRQNGPSAVRIAVPWACLSVLLYMVGVWILFQPMQMRGMMMP